MTGFISHALPQQQALRWVAANRFRKVISLLAGLLFNRGYLNYSDIRQRF
jgi:hypothetical protein